MLNDLLAFLGEWLPEGEFLGNGAWRWLTALAIFAGGFVLLRLIQGMVRVRVQALAQRQLAKGWLQGAVEVIDATRLWFLVVVAAFLASLALLLNERALAITRTAASLFLILQAVLWANAAINFAVRRYAEDRLTTDAAAVTTAAALAFLGKVALWSFALLLILANLGIDVTALVAGLGIGGVAVALAAQNILGDLFASLSIVLDKPFVLGDFIIVGDLMGTVEHIGLKTTRVRSLSGEQLIFPNGDLLQSRIRNFKRMQERRVVFTIGVTYDTPAAKVKAIPAMLREAVLAQEQVRFDRAHFQKYGDSALMYEVVYFVLTPDFSFHMDIQQRINFHILDRFAHERIQFAFPTRTVYAHVSQLADV